LGLRAGHDARRNCQQRLVDLGLSTHASREGRRDGHDEMDAYSNGFHVSIAEECTYDRSEFIHKVNLFDLHHKYVDVMHLDEVESYLDQLAAKPSTLQAAE
jgi:hypothetical protein